MWPTATQQPCRHRVSSISAGQENSSICTKFSQSQSPVQLCNASCRPCSFRVFDIETCVCSLAVHYLVPCDHIRIVSVRVLVIMHRHSSRLGTVRAPSLQAPFALQEATHLLVTPAHASAYGARTLPAPVKSRNAAARTGAGRARSDKKQWAQPSTSEPARRCTPSAALDTAEQCSFSQGAAASLDASSPVQSSGAGSPAAQPAAEQSGRSASRHSITLQLQKASPHRSVSPPPQEHPASADDAGTRASPAQVLQRSAKCPTPGKGSQLGATSSALLQNPEKQQVVTSLEKALADLERDARERPNSSPHCRKQHGDDAHSFATSLDSLAALEAEIAAQHRRLLAAGMQPQQANSSFACLSPSASTLTTSDPQQAHSAHAKPAALPQPMPCGGRPADGTQTPVVSPQHVAHSGPSTAAVTACKTVRPQHRSSMAAFAYSPRSVMDGTQESSSEALHCSSGAAAQPMASQAQPSEMSLSVEERLRRLGLSVRICPSRDLSTCFQCV
jgi:hypothetical protein